MAFFVAHRFFQDDVRVFELNTPIYQFSSRTGFDPFKQCCQQFFSSLEPKFLV